MVVALLPRKRFIKYTWVPSHLKQHHVNEGIITQSQLRLTNGPDALTTLGRDANSPPASVCVDLKVRASLVRTLQLMLVAIHFSRESKEKALR